MTAISHRHPGSGQAANEEAVLDSIAGLVFEKLGEVMRSLPDLCLTILPCNEGESLPQSKKGEDVKCLC
jgi:hypothetical protein